MRQVPEEALAAIMLTQRNHAINAFMGCLYCFVRIHRTCVSGIWAHERQTNDSNLRVFNELRL
jgi:hypothetical protein